MTEPSEQSSNEPQEPAPAQEPEEATAPPVDGDWHRQHPAALFFNILQAVRAMLFPIIAGMVAARGIFLFTFLGIMLLFSIGAALLRYWRYRYRFAEHELIVEQGWFFRQVRHISYVKVQNINITRNVLHRLFGVSGMQLESASGKEAEAVMDALSTSAIEELHQRIDEAKGDETPVQVGGEAGEAGDDDGDVAARKPEREPRKRILRLRLAELVRHGLVSNRGMVLVAAAVGYIMQGPMGERILTQTWERVEQYAERLPAQVLEALGPVVWLVMAMGIFLLIMFVLSLLSIAYAIMRFYGFTLEGDTRSVRAEFGLFTRVTITIPRRRIQLIGVRANPFHRFFRRVAVKVETAGLTGGEEGGASLRWLAPILPENELPRLLDEVQPEIRWAECDWQPLHPKTRARLIRIRLIVLAVFAIAFVSTLGTPGLWVLLVIPLVFAYARGYFNYAGWATTEGAIAFRSGWLVKQQSVVRYSKIQTVTLTQNPFDRRWGMATVSVDTAGADPAGHRVHARFLEYDVAKDLKEFLEEKTRATEFVW